MWSHVSSPKRLSSSPCHTVVQARLFAGIMGVLVSRKQQDDLETAIKYDRPAEMRCVDSNSNSSEGPPIHHGLIEVGYFFVQSRDVLTSVLDSL